MKTKLLTLLTVIFTTLSFSQTTFTVDGLDYEVISTSPNEVKITGGTPATTDLVIPASVIDNGTTYNVTVIGVEAFGFGEDDLSRRSIPTVTTLALPNTIRVIEEFAFFGNQITGELIIPDSVITIERFVFSENQIIGVTLSENLTEIPEQAFAFNDIAAITLPDGITAIGETAFSGNALTELVVPEGVTTIGEDAFRQNDLITVTIPSTVTSIGGAAFELNAISQFTSLATAAPSIITEGFQATFDNEVSNATLNIPQNALRNYLDKGWGIFGTIIPGNGAPFQSAFTVDGIEYLVLGLQPNEVMVIGQEATLTSITIPETVSDAGRTYDVVAVREFAFDGAGLTSITFPNTLREIGVAAFRGNQLTSVVLPDDLNVLGREAFSNNLINSLTINTNLTEIGDLSFQNNQLTSIDIPNNITNIGSTAFRNNQITSLVIPNSVTSIGGSAFGDNNIASLTLSDNLTTIDGFTFRNNNLTSVTIPDGVTLIGDNAFDNNQLESLIIPNSVTSISFRAFQNNNIASLTIGSGLSSLGGFDNFRNNNLTTVTIPSTVTSMGLGRNFADNPLTTVIVEATTPPTVVTGTNDTFGNRQNIDLTIPDGTEDAYEVATWTGFKSVNGVEQITVGTTFEVAGLNYTVTNVAPNEVEVTGGTNIPSNLVLPQTVSFQDETFTLVRVANNAFKEKGLTSLQLPNTIRTIGNEAFQSNQLTTLTIPTSVTTIGFRAFRLNQIEGELIIPNSVTGWSFAVFEANNISSITISESITNLPNQIFRNNNLTSVTIPANITSIGQNSFRDNPLTEVISLNENPPSINTGGSTDTFFNNRSNIDLTVPNTTEQAYIDNGWTGFKTINGEIPIEVGRTFVIDGLSYRIKSVAPNEVDAIGGPSVPQDLTIPASVTFQEENFAITGIGTNAYDGITLTSLVLPNTIKSIGNFAFDNNDLGAITIPEGVETIGQRAFRNNDLTDLTIPSSMVSIGQSAFGANPLETITALGTTPATIGTTTFGGSFGGIDLTIPDGTEAAYEATGWVGFRSVNGVINITVGLEFDVDGLSYRVTSLAPNEVEVIGGISIPANLVLTETVNFQDENFTLVSVANNAFQEASLATVTMPNTVTSIGDAAFFDNQLAAVTLPADLITIGDLAFEANQLTTITIPNMVQTIGERAFRVNDLQTVVVPNSVTSLGNSAFQGNELTSVTLSENITSIGNGTFDVNNLTEIIIPNGVETIGSRAFRSNQLTDLILPSSITTITNEAFIDNPLETITTEGTIPATIGGNSFGARGSIDLTVPNGTQEDYIAAEWTGFRTINGVLQLEIGVTFEVGGVSYIITALEPNEVNANGGSAIPSNLVIPEIVTAEDTDFTVVGITSGAFESAGITSLSLPSTLREIGGIAFRFNAITEVVIPEGMTVINQRAFSNNDLVSVTLPESLEVIGFRSFERNEIESIDIPDTVTQIQGFAFDLNNLTELRIPANVSSIGGEAFNRNDLVTIVSEIMLPPNVAGNAFGNRGNTDLFIPVGTEQAYIDAAWTGFKSTTEANKALAIKVFLQGAAINPNAGEENLMRDDLRAAGLIPNTSPYEDAEVLLDTIVVDLDEGEDSIVDWVFVELRDAIDSSIVIEGKSALLQRDGDVVGIDAVSPLTFNSDPDDYFIAVKHRNHLGVILERVKRLSSVATVLDFTKANSPITLGTNAQTDLGLPTGVLGMWAGDANADGTVRFSGTNAEPTAVRDGVLNAPSNPFGSLLFTLNGYLDQDVNMDGQVRFSGGDSEPLFVRDNVLGNPGNPFGSLLFTITSQIPQSPN